MHGHAYQKSIFYYTNNILFSEIIFNIIIIINSYSKMSRSRVDIPFVYLLSGARIQHSTSALREIRWHITGREAVML